MNALRPLSLMAVALIIPGATSAVAQDEAKAKGWIVISMKNDWKRIFAFDK